MVIVCVDGKDGRVKLIVICMIFTEILVKTSMKTLFSLLTPNLLCPPKTDHQHLLHPLLSV